MNRSELCSLAQELRNSDYVVVITIKAVLCLIAVICGAAILRKEGYRWLVHPNAKIIFSCHVVWSIGIPASLLVAYVFDIIRLWPYQSDPCDYLIPIKTAFFICYPYAVCIFCQSATMLALAIERTISTIFAEKYERINKPYLGILLVVITTSFGLYLAVYYLLLPNKSYSGYWYVTTCRTEDNADRWQITTRAYFAMEIIVVITFTVCLILARYRIHRRKLQKHGNLGYKYQAVENNKVIISLLPCFIVNAVLDLIGSIGLSIVVMFDYSAEGPITMSRYIEYLSQMYLYSIILPVVLFFRKKYRKRAVEVVNQNSAQGHMDMLNRMWSAT